MASPDVSRYDTLRGTADDAASQNACLNVEDDDPETEDMPDSTISRVEWYHVAQASIPIVGWTSKSEELEVEVIEAASAQPGVSYPAAGISRHPSGYAESMGNPLENTAERNAFPNDCVNLQVALENMDAEHRAAGMSCARPGQSYAVDSLSTRALSFPLEGSASPDGASQAEDDEAVLQVHTREVSAQSNSTCLAEDEEALPQVQVRVASAQSNAIYPAENEEAVLEVQDRSAQSAGVGQVIHALPVAAREAPSYSRNASADALSFLIDLNHSEPNALCIFAGSGLVACAVAWWHLHMSFPSTGTV